MLIIMFIYYALYQIKSIPNYGSKWILNYYFINNRIWDCNCIKGKKKLCSRKLSIRRIQKNYVRWKRFNVAIGNIFSNLSFKGAKYLGNELLCQLILANYPDKVKNGILFITRTALWHFASRSIIGVFDSTIVNILNLFTVVQKTFNQQFFYHQQAY